jgi:hypothetical protein
MLTLKIIDVFIAEENQMQNHNEINKYIGMNCNNLVLGSSLDVQKFKNKLG